MKPITQIRSIAIAKANTLQRAARYFETLRPAFSEWAEGAVYVCKKTGTYRYRFGAASKSVTPWDSLARSVFASPEAFAFAAMVLAERQQALPAPEPAPVQETGRVNVISLAA